MSLVLISVETSDESDKDGFYETVAVVSASSVKRYRALSRNRNSSMEFVLADVADGLKKGEFTLEAPKKAEQADLEELNEFWHNYTASN